MSMTIGQRMRAWRQHFDRNQTDCAEAMGLQTSALSRIENGWNDKEGMRRFQHVTAEQLEAFATFLGLSMAEFYGDLPVAPETDQAANG